ncbi:hypothetical protein Dimus_036885 [Dionaea muscipula]
MHTAVADFVGAASVKVAGVLDQGGGEKVVVRQDDDLVVGGFVVDGQQVPLVVGVVLRLPSTDGRQQQPSQPADSSCPVAGSGHDGQGGPQGTFPTKDRGGPIRFAVTGATPSGDVLGFTLSADDIPSPVGAVSWASGTPPSEPISESRGRRLTRPRSALRKGEGDSTERSGSSSEEAGDGLREEEEGMSVSSISADPSPMSEDLSNRGARLVTF